MIRPNTYLLRMKDKPPANIQLEVPSFSLRSWNYNLELWLHTDIPPQYADFEGAKRLIQTRDIVIAEKKVVDIKTEIDRLGREIESKKRRIKESKKRLCQMQRYNRKKGWRNLS